MKRDFCFIFPSCFYFWACFNVSLFRFHVIEFPLKLLDLAPNLWKRESLGYAIPEGGAGSCKKCKRPIPQSLSEKLCSWRRPVANRSRKWHVSWASQIPRFINGVRS